MEKKDNIAQIEELMAKCGVRWETLAQKTRQPQWIIEAVKSGKVANSTTINAIVNVLKEMEAALGKAEEKQDEAAYITAALLSTPPKSKTPPKPKATPKTEKKVVKEQKPKTEKKQKNQATPKKNKVSEQPAIIYYADLGKLTMRIMKYTIEYTDFKLAKWLQGRKVDTIIIGKIKRGEYPNETLYHEIIRKCIERIVLLNGLKRDNWDYSVMSYYRYTALMNGELKADAPEYLKLFEYISRANVNTSGANVKTSKRKRHRISSHNHAISTEGNSIRWSSYSANSGFDYGITDT